MKTILEAIMPALIWPALVILFLTCALLIAPSGAGLQLAGWLALAVGAILARR